MSDTQADKKRYKKTLNLPKTGFAMRANLVQREPAIQKRWLKNKLYRQITDQQQGRAPFVFHDGPPYANGDIHLGHLLNKVLKDIVLRSRTMAGFDVHFVPGWDCHGLPIEHKVVEQLGDKAREMEPMQIRKRCQDYANKFVKLQKDQMQRLGTTGDYDNPYITMDRQYEAAVLEVFAELIAQGLVYRGLKPVHWSIANRTALADAELEYDDREDTSVFVLFPVNTPDRLPASLNAPADQTVHLMIWTTTPWTLPANLAVAVSPQFVYGLYRFTQAGQTRYAVLAEALAQKVLAREADPDSIQQLGTCTGEALAQANVTYQHPFCDDDRTRPVVTADYVTLEDGTGMVHTAPGHGVEDYQTALRLGLEIYCPVKADGTFDNTAPQWLQGPDIDVWQANQLVCQKLTDDRYLFHQHQFMHSYPHDWRGKTPVIFRATEQWFIAVDRPTSHDGKTLRELALGHTAEDVKFIPDWGRNRMRGMLENRPDWCISRQRAWGLPIPAFYNADDQPLQTAASVKAVAKIVNDQGSDCWFKMTSEELLADYDPTADPEAPDWAKTTGGLTGLTKSKDIFDVWFDSGSSWNAVLALRNIGRSEDDYQADLYLEGSDQHRGWFQVSLLTALGVKGRPPFKSVLTHGFMVDAEGRKMSKSLGNALNVEELLKHFGADVCRWWVSSTNYANDIKVDLKFFELAGEEYRKVRNTIRFLLSNLNDFDPQTDRCQLTDADATSIDAWAVGQLNQLITETATAYRRYQFRRVHEAIFNFCNETVSAVYGNACKDRLYCDKPEARRRRRTQTVMYDIAHALIRLVAPILVHTADEAWYALHGENIEQSKNTDSVHLQPMPDPIDYQPSPHWDAAMALADRALKELEKARSERGIDNPLDAGIQVTLDAATMENLQAFAHDLADICGVSRFTLLQNDHEQITIDDLRSEPVCQRSWKRDGTVRERSDGGMLTHRDAEAVGVS